MRHALLALIVLAAGGLPPAAGEGAVPAGCAVLAGTPLGDLCAAEERRAPHAWSHGPDPVPLAALALPASAPPRAPACAPDAYAVRLVYAHAPDRPDRRDALRADLLATVHAANGLLHAASARQGRAADLEFRCDDAGVAVERATLRTPAASARFWTIVADLHALGYRDPREKILVFYDDTAACPGCLGIALRAVDDRPGAANAHNGNFRLGGEPFPMFAVNFGHLGARGALTTLHELGHVLGAVQDSAPHASGGGHCNDGLDVMCYDDGGPRSAYRASACAVLTWDCGADDYAHASPRAGSYLATRWNLASEANRYVALEPRAGTLVLRPGARAPDAFDVTLSRAGEAVAICRVEAGEAACEGEARALGGLVLRVPAGRTAVRVEAGDDHLPLVRNVNVVAGRSAVVPVAPLPAFATVRVALPPGGPDVVDVEVREGAAVAARCRLGAPEGDACEGAGAAARGGGELRVPLERRSARTLVVAPAGDHAGGAAPATAHVRLAPGGSVTLVPKLQPYAVTATLTGCPAAGAAVTFAPAEGDPRVVTADARGRATATWLPAGPVLVAAEAGACAGEALAEARRPAGRVRVVVAPVLTE